MRSFPLYALLCFQLAFAPAALSAQPTWEAKRAHMAKEVKEALKSLEELDRTGPLCSDNYVKSQCPSIMPPPKQTFVEAAKKNLKELDQALAGIAPDAKIADQAFDAKKLAGVDGCSGAGTSAAADAAKRKAAVDKMNTVFTEVNNSLSSDLGKLFEGGAAFQSKVKACVAGSNLNFIQKAVVNANLPEYPHGALDYLWTPDSAHKSCPRSGVETFRKLTGAKKGDGNAQLARLAGTSKEYSAILAQNSADLTKHTQLAAKVDCNTAEKPKAVTTVENKGKKPDVSGTEVKPATLASEEGDKKPKPKPDTVKPVTETAPADQTPVTTTAETQVQAPVDTTASVDNVVPAETPLTPEQPPAEQGAGLSKGAVIGGLAILGVGAGAAYLIFSKKDKDKGSDTGGRIPSSTGTKTSSSTQTGTTTATSSGTKTATSTSTSTGPTSSNPYTGTLTSTTMNTATATSTESGTATETATSSATSTETRE